MNIKKNIINNYYIDQSILYILPHSISRYIHLVSRYVFVLIVLFILYFLFSQVINNIDIWFWIAGVFLYIAFVYGFGDIYLDSEIITDEYLIVLDNNWFVWSSTSYYSLDHIEEVSYTQNSRLDYILDTWDIYISLSQDSKITIPHIYNPQKQVQNIIQTKNQFMLEKIKRQTIVIQEENEITKPEATNITEEKFQILVDSLSEIVSDYIHKWIPNDKNQWNNEPTHPHPF